MPEVPVAVARAFPPPSVLFALLLLLGLVTASDAAAQPRPERFVRAWLVDSHEAEVLFRPVDILVTRGCSVWVTDAGSSRVHRWTCNGDPLPALGREGEGPGEFMQPSSLAALGGDTIGIWDRPTQRLSLFSERGTLLGARRIAVVGGEHGFVRAVARAGSATVVSTDNFPGGTRRANESSSFVWLVREDGVVDRPLLRFPGPATYIERTPTGSASVAAPFRRRPVVLFERGGTALIGNTGSDRLQRYRTGARMVPRGEITLGVAGSAVSRADRRHWLDSVRTAMGAELERGPLSDPERASFRRLHETLLDRVEFPERRNAYILATLDEAGNLWLQLDVVLPGGGSRWQVHRAADGRRLRVIDVPTRGQIKAAAATSTGLYVIEVGHDDVARVGRYAPPRRPASRPNR